MPGTQRASGRGPPALLRGPELSCSGRSLSWETGTRPHHPWGGFRPQGMGHMEKVSVRLRSLPQWSENYCSTWPPFPSVPSLQPQWPLVTFSKGQFPSCVRTWTQAVPSARNALPPFFRFLKLILMVCFCAKRLSETLSETSRVHSCGCSGLSPVGRKHTHTHTQDYSACECSKYSRKAIWGNCNNI